MFSILLIFGLWPLGDLCFLESFRVSQRPGLLWFTTCVASFWAYLSLLFSEKGQSGHMACVSLSKGRVPDVVQAKHVAAVPWDPKVEGLGFRFVIVVILGSPYY